MNNKLIFLPKLIIPIFNFFNAQISWHKSQNSFSKCQNSFTKRRPLLLIGKFFCRLSFAFINYVSLLVLLDHFSISAEAFLRHWDGELVEVWRQNVAGMLRLEDRIVVVGTQLKGQFQKQCKSCIFMP